MPHLNDEDRSRLHHARTLIEEAAKSAGLDDPALGEELDRLATEIELVVAPSAPPPPVHFSL